ncbi:MAG: hypothetical protein GC204_20915 [Chloroflexi bacterium]|nr:hypothetical protein [Chloroflexota bacterium]
MQQPEDDNKTIKTAFNRSGMYLYGVVSGVTSSICVGVFCLGMALKGGDHTTLWAIGAALGAAGMAGGIFEATRVLKEETHKNAGDGTDELTDGPDSDPADRHDRHNPPQP